MPVVGVIGMMIDVDAEVVTQALGPEPRSGRAVKRIQGGPGMPEAHRVPPLSLPDRDVYSGGSGGSPGTAARPHSPRPSGLARCRHAPPTRLHQGSHAPPTASFSLQPGRDLLGRACERHHTPRGAHYCSSGPSSTPESWSGSARRSTPRASSSERIKLWMRMPVSMLSS